MSLIREAILENKEVTAFTATDSYMRERAQEREMVRQELVEKQKALNPRRRGYGDLDTGLDEKGEHSCISLHSIAFGMHSECISKTSRMHSSILECISDAFGMYSKF